VRYKAFLNELRSGAKSHAKNGEVRTAYMLLTAAERIDALLLKPRNDGADDEEFEPNSEHIRQKP